MEIIFDTRYNDSFTYLPVQVWEEKFSAVMADKPQNMPSAEWEEYAKEEADATAKAKGEMVRLSYRTKKNLNCDIPKSQFEYLLSQGAYIRKG